MKLPKLPSLSLSRITNSKKRSPLVFAAVAGIGILAWMNRDKIKSMIASKAMYGHTFAANEFEQDNDAFEYDDDLNPLVYSNMALAMRSKKGKSHHGGSKSHKTKKKSHGHSSSRGSSKSHGTGHGHSGNHGHFGSSHHGGGGSSGGGGDGGGGSQDTGSGGMDQGDLTGGNLPGGLGNINDLIRQYGGGAGTGAGGGGGGLFPDNLQDGGMGGGDGSFGPQVTPFSHHDFDGGGGGFGGLGGLSVGGGNIDVGNVHVGPDGIRIGGGGGYIPHYDHDYYPPPPPPPQPYYSSPNFYGNDAYPPTLNYDQGWNVDTTSNQVDQSGYPGDPSGAYLQNPYAAPQYDQYGQPIIQQQQQGYYPYPSQPPIDPYGNAYGQFPSTYPGDPNQPVDLAGSYSYPYGQPLDVSNPTDYGNVYDYGQSQPYNYDQYAYGNPVAPTYDMPSTSSYGFPAFAGRVSYYDEDRYPE